MVATSVVQPFNRRLEHLAYLEKIAIMICTILALQELEESH
jgi:hypothetical protein